VVKKTRKRKGLFARLFRRPAKKRTRHGTPFGYVRKGFLFSRRLPGKKK